MRVYEVLSHHTDGDKAADHAIAYTAALRTAAHMAGMEPLHLAAAIIDTLHNAPDRVPDLPFVEGALALAQAAAIHMPGANLIEGDVPNEVVNAAMRLDAISMSMDETINPGGEA